MPKITRVQVLDATKNPVAGAAIKMTGCGDDRLTDGSGITQFLVDELAELMISINGARVWTGTYSALKATEVFVQTGQTFARQD
jgi:hypothetical protein